LGGSVSFPIDGEEGNMGRVLTNGAEEGAWNHGVEGIGCPMGGGKGAPGLPKRTGKSVKLL